MRIGSVEPDLFAPRWRLDVRRVARDGWQVHGDDLTARWARIAEALRAAGLAHAWRDEQLAVRG